MTLSNKKILLLSSIFTFFLTSQAFALPIAGTKVLMENDWEVPYSMKLQDGTDTVYQTFCLESQNYFTPNTLYWVESVGDYVKGGGVNTTEGDQLSFETKWLYAAYMSNVFSGTKDVALTVQRAIWHLEGEVGGSSLDWEDLSKYKFDASGWNVVAVNITTGDGADNQSQLVGTAPVPEPATMLLFGTGLAGLAGARLRRKKK